MSKELKTGIISLIIITIGIWGYNFLKGNDIFNPSNRVFYVEYENVGGLKESSEVTINGLTVGKIKKIRFNKNIDKKGVLVVEFFLNTDFEFSKKSIVKIYSPSPIGDSKLAIIPSYEGEKAISGDYLKGKIETSLFSSIGERLDPLQLRFDDVLKRVDTLITSVNIVLNKNAQKSLNKGIIGLEKTIGDIRKTLNSFNMLLDKNKVNLGLITSNSKKITNNFSKISDDLAQSNLSNTIKKFDKTINNFNVMFNNFNKGKGTLGKLMNDDKLYTNLMNSSKEMELLLREIKLNPKRFVHFSLFGKKPKPYRETTNNNTKK